ncbi:MAG: hypothetical protein Q7K33_03695 [Candidatus Berkelbacteria bacterium]|nr:hypothetical protein [Candidatus Berkelbacteria bacterium]
MPGERTGSHENNGSENYEPNSEQNEEEPLRELQDLIAENGICFNMNLSKLNDSEEMFAEALPKVVSEMEGGNTAPEEAWEIIENYDGAFGAIHGNKFMAWSGGNKFGLVFTRNHQRYVPLDGQLLERWQSLRSSLSGEHQRAIDKISEKHIAWGKLLEAHNRLARKVITVNPSVEQEYQDVLSVGDLTSQIRSFWKSVRRREPVSTDDINHLMIAVEQQMPDFYRWYRRFTRREGKNIQDPNSFVDYFMEEDINPEIEEYMRQISTGAVESFRRTFKANISPEETQGWGSGFLQVCDEIKPVFSEST